MTPTPHHGSVYYFLGVRLDDTGTAHLVGLKMDLSRYQMDPDGAFERGCLDALIVHSLSALFVWEGEVDIDAVVRHMQSGQPVATARGAVAQVRFASDG